MIRCDSGCDSLLMSDSPWILHCDSPWPEGAVMGYLSHSTAWILRYPGLRLDQMAVGSRGWMPPLRCQLFGLHLGYGLGCTPWWAHAELKRTIGLNHGFEYVRTVGSPKTEIDPLLRQFEGSMGTSLLQNCNTQSCAMTGLTQQISSQSCLEP